MLGVGLVVLLGAGTGWAAPGLAGVDVVPHVQMPALRYMKDPDPSLGARVQVFVKNTGDAPLAFSAEAPITARGMSPAALLEADAWAWHDFPGALENDAWTLPPGGLSVLSFNGSRADWGVGTSAALGFADGTTLEVPIAAPQAWISAATFLGPEEAIAPDRLVLHIANAGAAAVQVRSVRLWLPASNAAWRALLPGPAFPLPDGAEAGRIPAGDKGVVEVATGPLPLGYAAVEVATDGPTLWTHLRVRKESFDISGGWVGGKNALTFEPFLRFLHRIHVNTGHLRDGVAGYTDQTGPEGLYTKYPLKFFSDLRPFSTYDTDAMLPRIHAAEFLGEPQYGGGRPVPPMEVWRELAAYHGSRIPTSVTHSEERIWRFYSGLSDFPHYDAYRVTAPAADVWRKYDWPDGKRIGWGAPLETIGDLSRSLRDLNRPLATAYWSQGPHEGWGIYGQRKRTSPTPDEIRLQAYHALASRITSLYWFNLSLASVVKFPDTLAELGRIGREMRMLEEFQLAGDAYHYARVTREGRPDWDLSTVVSARGALLFALDLAYTPDHEAKVFVFGEPRAVTFAFPLPAYARNPQDVFRVDADGVHEVAHTVTETGVEIRDTASRVAVYVAAPTAEVRAAILARHAALVAKETALGFDPAGNPEDLKVLEEYAAR
jgi:hypothetical protein